MRSDVIGWHIQSLSMRTSYGALAAGAGAAVLSGLVLGVDGLQTWEKPSSFPGVSSLVSEAFCLDHNHDMSSKAPIEPPVRGAELKLVQVRPGQIFASSCMAGSKDALPAHPWL